MLLARLLLLALLCTATAHAFEVPDFQPNVVDRVGVLSDDEVRQLNTTIAKVRAESHIFAAVLIVPSTTPDAIEPAAEQTFRQWQLGSKGVDNGLLILVATNDRRMRLEVGYGLEGSIPDVKANRIIKNLMAPHFKRQEYFAGIDAALAACNDLALHGDALELKSNPDVSDFKQKYGPLIVLWMVLIVVVPICVRLLAVMRASRFPPSLQPTPEERSVWRILSPSGMSVFLTLFLLINPGIFFVALATHGLAFVSPLFVGFAYLFLGAANSGYLKMFKPSWREKFKNTRPKRRSPGGSWIPQAYDSSFSSSSSSSSSGSDSSSSSSSSSSSGGGSSGGGGASGSW